MLKLFGALNKRASKTWVSKRYYQVSEGTESIQNKNHQTFALNSKVTYTNVNEVEKENEVKLDIEVLEDKFEDWQKPLGKMKILHSINKLRIPFIKDGLLLQNKSRPSSLQNERKPLTDFRILDVGKGGGVLSEPLARMGAYVTGIGMNAAFATQAAEHSVRDPTLPPGVLFLNTNIEAFAKYEPEKYDAVIVTEILEYEKDKQLFLMQCLQTLKPGGSIFIVTLNRTLGAWIGGVALPDTLLDNMEKCSMPDTMKSITPAELSTLLKNNGCEPMTEQGMLYLYLNNTWYWTLRKSTSYAMHGIKHQR